METQPIIANETMEEIRNHERDVNNDQEREILRVRVKLIDERVFQVEVERGFTVLDFRGKVALVTDIPVHLQRLIYRGKLLKDGTLLSNYDIQDGHTVHLVAKRVQTVATPASPSALPSSTEATESSSEQNLFEREFSLNGESTYLDQGLSRSRARLRQLLRSTNDTVNTLNRPSTLRSTSVMRPRTTTRHVPGRDDSTGNEWNIAALREALQRTRDLTPVDTNNASESSTTQSSPRDPPLLPSIRGLFDERRQMAQHDVPASTSASTVNETTPTLDHIVQGIMMVQTVLSTASPAATGATTTITAEGEERPRPSPRRFFIGQWLDVLDTVNQWLESTVMDISDGKVLIHYHGWPSRWDEWLDVDSHRIAAFRTRTTQVLNPHQLSPSPTTHLPSAPHVQGQTIQQVIPQLRDLMRQVLPQMEVLADLCQQQTSLEDGVEVSSTITDELSENAHLIAPVLDRFGRLLTDSARQLDPLLRSELQREQRDRRLHRHPVQPVPGAPVQVEPSDATISLRSMRDLIVTSAPPSTDPPRRNIDVHIHAIISPSSIPSLASLERLRAAIAGSIGESTRQSVLGSPVPGDSFGLPTVRPLQAGTEGRSLLNDFADFDSLNSNSSTVDDSRIPLLSESERSNGNTRRSRHPRPSYMSNDTFGTSFSQDSDNLDDPVDGGRGTEDLGSEDIDESRWYQRILSPHNHRQDDEVVTDAPSIGVIPEIAQTEEQEQRRDESSDTNGSSSSPFPTLLQVLRRTLNDVRNFVRTDDDRSSSVQGTSSQNRTSINDVEDDMDRVD